MGLEMYIKKDKAYNKELRFIYHSIFEWAIRDWIKSVLELQVSKL